MPAWPRRRRSTGRAFQSTCKITDILTRRARARRAYEHHRALRMTENLSERLPGREALGRCYYFIFPDPKFGCQPAVAPFWLGAAAMVLIFSFLGFLDSRLPFCSLFATSLSLGWWIVR